MEQKIVMEQPIKYERDGREITKINDGWVTEDGKMFTRLLRKETFYYDKDGKPDDDRETTVVIEELETAKGTLFMKKKLRGTLFDDV